MTQPKDQSFQEHPLDWRKAIDATDYELSDWMTAKWRVPQSSTNGKILSQNKNYLPNVAENLELFMFSDDKSVDALKGTAEHKENHSIETQNWLTARKLVVKSNKTASDHGNIFRLQILLMMFFRKKMPFRDKIKFLHQTFNRWFFART